VSIKRFTSETGASRATFGVCPVDGGSCVVLEPLRERIIRELGEDGAAKLAEDAKNGGLPCGSCRKGARDARNLPGLRLGKHERRILLSVPPGSKCGWRAGGEMLFPADGEIVYPEGPSHADEVSNRRALRKLEHAGLIDLSRRYVWSGEGSPPEWFKVKQARSRYWGMGRRYRSAMLTPLGELVVERFRHELEAGKAIRWRKALNDIVENVQRPQGELFGQFGLWLGKLIFFAGLGKRSEKREDALKRLQAFVFTKGGA
jgi:hypothetical protein